MWYPVTVAAPGTEPVTSAQAKTQCRIDSSDRPAGVPLTSVKLDAPAIAADAETKVAARVATLKSTAPP